MFAFSFNVSAKKMELIDNIEPYGEFYIYGEQTENVAKAVGMKKAELENYCIENGVAYFAVNKDNTKQIKVTVNYNRFSEEIINISSLLNSDITALIPDITGIENSSGEIISKNGQKFVKTQFITTDSGGEYVLTQYYTVASSANFVLSFYTEASANKDYIEKTFESFSSPLFIIEKSEKANPVKSVILVASVIFGVACVVIIFTIIKDIRKDKKTPDTEETEENDN